MKRFAVFTAVLAFAVIISGCAERGGDISEKCVVTNDEGIVSGEEYWEDFLNDTVKGNKAEVKWCYKGADTEEYYTLSYRGGRFYYSQNGGEEAVFSYLRPLMGYFGNPRKESTMFVLTDSLELTCDDVHWAFLSSNTESVTDIPFVWIGFTTYIEDKRGGAAAEAIKKDICRMAEHIAASGNDESSNTYDYIEADRAVFDAIISAGESAAEYIEKILAEDGAEGLERDILQKAYEEIKNQDALSAS